MKDQAFLKSWIAALRSGDYKQGKGSLCSWGAYCCLGVGADLMGRLVEDGRGSSGVLDFEGDLHVDMLPWSWRDSGPFAGADLDKLARMNDGEPRGVDGVSFVEIADFLEKTYLTPSK